MDERTGEKRTCVDEPAEKRKEEVRPRVRRLRARCDACRARRTRCRRRRARGSGSGGGRKERRRRVKESVYDGREGCRGRVGENVGLDEGREPGWVDRVGDECVTERCGGHIKRDRGLRGDL